ncbi:MULTISPECIES: hypothetical protein [Gordonia]|uniref:hypothetical protein n=1 Tax=Gordonia TaxID=2053 RepID=UPI000AF156B0|nr:MULTISPECIES: hypothetical protein [Gordonia]MCM3894348.1 hypothetical protein [Gordonia sputi]
MLEIPDRGVQLAPSGTQATNRTRTYIGAAVALIIVVAIIVVIAITFKPGHAASQAASSSTPANPDQPLLLTLNDFPDGYVEGSAGTSAELAKAQRTEVWYTYEPKACTPVLDARADRTDHTTRVGFAAQEPNANTAYTQYLVRNDYNPQQMRDAILYPQCLTRTIDAHRDGFYTIRTTELPTPSSPSGTETLIVKSIVDIANSPADTTDHRENVNGYAWLPTGLLVSLNAEADGRGNSVDINQFNDLLAKATEKASR